MEGGLLSLKWNNHRSSFIHVLSSLRKKDSFCDVTLTCEGKFYPSHKFVLSTCSDYFQDMFQHTECKHPIIVLKDIKSEDLEALLNYMYVGEVNVVQEKLSSLIKSAECLRIKGLAVPDDPPKDSPSEKRNSSQHDGQPESKRRRSDHDHPRNKEFSKSSKSSSKSSDNFYRSNTSSHSSFNRPRGQFQESPEDEGYSYANEDSYNMSKNKEERVNFIKQEPPEDLNVGEDTKEGILESANSSFLNPVPHPETSHFDPIPTSDSQDIWGSESRADDDYQHLEGGPPCESATEDSSQNEAARDDTDPRSCSSYPSASSMYPRSSAGHVCQRCNYVARDKTNLRKHIFTHTGEKPFTCKLCDYKTTQSSNLHSHFRRRHAQRAQNLDEDTAMMAGDDFYPRSPPQIPNFPREVHDSH